MNKKQRGLIAGMLLLYLGTICVSAASSTWPYRDETAVQRDARMGWWRDARFGMFIHWGVYSVPAGSHDGKQIPRYGEW